jgi:hypothetical protein
MGQTKSNLELCLICRQFLENGKSSIPAILMIDIKSNEQNKTFFLMDAAI